MLACKHNHLTVVEVRTFLDEAKSSRLDIDVVPTANTTTFF